jgi:succinate dehydrogenase/fumarate reductase flavoprotein subunit
MTAGLPVATRAPSSAPADTADVVVAGGGLGGMAAAVCAAREGADVLVIEALPAIGGNAAMSTGYIAFAGFARQREDGIEDAPDRLVADLLAEIERDRDRYGIAFDEELARLYAARSAEAYAFLTGLGIAFGRFIERPEQHTVTRMLALEDTSAFRTCFERAFAELGVRTRLRTRVTSLTTDGWRVTGVVADAGDGPVHIAARRAVVLATGGYQANHELRLRFQPEAQARTPYYGVDTARGDGHVIGQAIGGALVNMTYIPMFIRAPSRLLEDAIAVNVHGERFEDETGPYLERVARLRAQPGGGWYVFDERVAREKALLVRHLPEQPRRARTIAGVAELIGAPAGALEATIAGWNRIVANGGEGDPFGRSVFPRERGGIVEPPFAIAPMIVGASFTGGGFSVTEDLQVKHVDGSVIESLYAVGDCVGGVNPAAGLGGVHLGSAATFGMIAGRAAARLEART